MKMKKNVRNLKNIHTYETTPAATATATATTAPLPCNQNQMRNTKKSVLLLFLLTCITAPSIARE
jgi:hypothetical protein